MNFLERILHGGINILTINNDKNNLFQVRAIAFMSNLLSLQFRSLIPTPYVGTVIETLIDMVATLFNAMRLVDHFKQRRVDQQRFNLSFNDMNFNKVHLN